MKFENEKLQYEYEKLLAYEIELTKTRWTVFAAFFSVSFVIAGFALRGGKGIHDLDLWSKYAIAFGFLVYLAAAYHYFWYHAISHRIRAKLKKIENSQGIEIINIRIRPKCCGLKIHFHWMIWIVGLAYSVLTCMAVGPLLFLIFTGALFISIVILALIYKCLPDEPFEGKKEKNKK